MIFLRLKCDHITLQKNLPLLPIYLENMPEALKWTRLWSGLSSLLSNVSLSNVISPNPTLLCPFCFSHTGWGHSLNTSTHSRHLHCLYPLTGSFPRRLHTAHHHFLLSDQSSLHWPPNAKRPSHPAFSFPINLLIFLVSFITTWHIIFHLFVYSHLFPLECKLH